MEKQVLRFIVASVEKRGIVLTYAVSAPLSVHLSTLKATNSDLLAIQADIKDAYGILVPVVPDMSINQLVSSILFQLKHQLRK